MEAGHVIFSCFMTLAGIAGFGYLIHQSKSQAVESSAKRKLNAVPVTGNTGTTPAQRAGLSRDVEIDRRQRLLEEFRQYMISSQELLIACCDIIEYIQDVLTWGHPRVSPIFYASTFIALVVCAVLPFRWFVIISISCVFAVNYTPLQDSLTSKKTQKLGDDLEGTPEGDKNDTETPPVPGSKEIIQHPEIRIDGASTQTPTPNTPSSEDSTEDEEKPKYTVSIRDRAATAPEAMMKGYSGDKPSESGDHSGGHCFQCGVAFTSLLKRRKYCRHCGNDFCSKCCKHKLPRTAFGATAPAAQTEKELVCNACFVQLTAEEAASADKG
ncbi:protrudin-like [Amphiura filiformis]|uniref:protrudin-like n=1 Tax=Amphiura filiformis TaxID=82378 RepID=UPI003B221119